MKDWTRRDLLQGGMGMAASGLFSTHRSLAASGAGGRKAAIIGHTGAGDYGHGIERIFAGLPGIMVVAVADPDDAGRAKAKAACGAARDYADYREMLDKEKPELVGIGPRWAGEHHAMAMAALKAGAHLYLEKPFTISLAEADDILRVAREKERRIAVAHVARCAPNVLRLEKALRDGLIGEVLEIHTVGKMGSRAGGQDMMVLGLHVFDLARLFAGDVQWCHARIRQQGKLPAIGDAKESPSDRVGPVVGDDIFAQFAMASGVNVTFRSRVGLEKAAGPFGMEIIGSRGVMRLNSGFMPTPLASRRAEPRCHDPHGELGGLDRRCGAFRRGADRRDHRLRCRPPARGARLAAGDRRETRAAGLRRARHESDRDGPRRFPIRTRGQAGRFSPRPENPSAYSRVRRAGSAHFREIL